MSFIRRWLGHEKCEICRRWTEPSIMYGNICSYDCLKIYFQIKKTKGGKKEEMGNATTKQIEALRKMGYHVPNTLSFEEARTLFDSHNNKPKFEAALALGAPVQKIPARIESKSYHLTPEQVRYNALDIVLRRYPNLETPALLKEAETVEKWMLE